MQTIKPWKKLKKAPEDRKTSHVPGVAGENGYTTQSNLHIRWNSHQNLNIVLHINRKINPKIHVEE
jgi:hypothetical protein